MVASQESLALKRIAPFYRSFQGVLVLVMLDMGLVAGERLQDLKQVKVFNYLCFLCAYFKCDDRNLLWLSGRIICGWIYCFRNYCCKCFYIVALRQYGFQSPDASPAYYLTSTIVLTFPLTFLWVFLFIINLLCWVFKVNFYVRKADIWEYYP